MILLHLHCIFWPSLANRVVLEGDHENSGDKGGTEENENRTPEREKMKMTSLKLEGERNPKEQSGTMLWGRVPAIHGSCVNYAIRTLFSVNFGDRTYVPA